MNVEVNNPACSHIHHEDVEQPRAGRYGDEEVARENALGVVAHERHPTLGRGAASRAGVIGHIASDGQR